MSSAPLRFRRFGPVALAASLLISLTACSPDAFTQTPFVREAQDAASLLSAASMTIEYAHSGKMDDRFARSSLDIYREPLAGMALSLPRQRGAPDRSTLAPVVELLRDAQAVLADPCLDDSCDWRGQVAILDDASRALLELGQ